MAGHSKWANIKFRKSAQDAKRGKLFTKFIREITVAARQGGADVSANPRLRTAIDKALEGNMTRDTIDRAIKRGIGGEEEQNLEEIRYEGYGPGGVAIMVDCLSDNRNRTVSEVRHAFTKHGGNLGTDGSVSYLFSKLGQIIIAADVDEEQIIEVAIEAGASEVETQEDGSTEIQTSVENFAQVQEALKQSGIKPEAADITMLAAITVELEAEQATAVLKLIERLEDLDDVQNVYTNADLSAALVDEE